MASLETHLQKAAHHRNCLTFLQTRNEFADWTAIVAFYAAMELVEAVLAIDGMHSRDHGDRKQTLRQRFRDGRRRAFYEAYNDLYEYSLDARYFHAVPSETTLSHLLACLGTVESFATSLINKNPSSED